MVRSAHPTRHLTLNLNLELFVTKETFMTTPPYEPRTYRTRMARAGLDSFRVAVKETDLWVLADRDFSRRGPGNRHPGAAAAWRPTSQAIPAFSRLSPPGRETPSPRRWSGR